jgi:hypothetical protein
MDLSFKRRLANEKKEFPQKATEISKVEAREKALLSAHRMVLDIGRPLFFIRESIDSDERFKESPIAKATETALRLWAEKFASVTKNRRENLLKFTNPQFVSLLDQSSRFNKKECDWLFGDTFIDRMVKEAGDDKKLKSLGRVGGSSARYTPRSSGFSGDYRGAFSRGFNRGNSYNKGGNFSHSGGFSSSQNKGNFSGNSSNNFRSVSHGYLTPPVSPTINDFTPPISPSVNHLTRPISSPPVGGRLRLFASRWREITQDPWVIRSVSDGYQVAFVEEPSQTVSPDPISMSAVLFTVCDQEVKSLLLKGAIEPVKDAELFFISTIFAIPKPSGGFRPVINLRALNKFVYTEHFKMEGIPLLREMVRPGDFFTKIDLRDAYFTVALHTADRKYFQFRWEGRLYRFTCLPFGLSAAPWVFTKLLKPLMSHLRSMGIRLIIYLDDILVMNQTLQGAEKDFRTVVSLLVSCGFLVHDEKSIGSARQVIEFLGLVVDSRTLTLSLRTQKVSSIIDLCKRLGSAGLVTLKDVAKLLGNFSWAIQAVPFAQAHYRSLQQLFISESQRFSHVLHTKVTLEDNCKLELAWWASSLAALNGRPLLVREPDVVVYSDASNTGWGAVCDGVTTNGHWDLDDRARHINELELLAALYALKVFTKQARDISVRLFLDNSTAVHYINKSGGTRSRSLTAVAAQLVSWCEERSITVQAIHLPGALNVIADRQSRVLQDSSDWMLHPEIFHQLLCLWEMEVDLFASSWNRQLKRFISWQPQPDALSVNAFTMNWRPLRGYAFPPFGLIPKCLSKLRTDRAEVTLVAPVWPSQPWFPVLLELAVQPPLILPNRRDLLQGPQGLPHPLLDRGALILAAWRLSGVASEATVFRQAWSNFCWAEIVKPHQLLTRAHGTTGMIGVFDQIRIPCHLLE